MLYVYIEHSQALIHKPASAIELENLHTVRTFMKYAHAASSLCLVPAK